MNSALKKIGVITAAMAVPASAVEAQQAVSVDSVDGYYNGSVV